MNEKTEFLELVEENKARYNIIDWINDGKNFLDIKNNSIIYQVLGDEAQRI